MKSKKEFRVEKSAGGIVIRRRQGKLFILMVEVRNLQGEIRWTFPKGHLEGDETNEQAALREVEEETGWRCAIAPTELKTAFDKVTYWFERGEALIQKEVVWYIMDPVQKTGEGDPDEIRKVRWVTLNEARRKATYPSDIKLLKKLNVLLRE